MLPTGSIPAQIHVTGCIAHFPAESKRYGAAKDPFPAFAGQNIR
jgi:hypothetical protein